MAVYTKLEQEEINNILLNYKLGRLKKFEGIKEGIENTNYSIETEKGKYILTIYERRVKKTDLPFFSNLMVELSKNGFVLRHGYIKPLYHEPIFKKKICFGNKGYPFTINKRNKQINYNNHKEWKNCEEINRKVFLTSSIYHPYTLKDMDKLSKLLEKCLK